MTTEQQRKMLECAAKACGIEGRYNSITDVIVLADLHVLPYAVDRRWWNPITNSADCAEMCAKLDINTFYYMSLPKVECSLEDAGDEQVIRYSVCYADNPGEKLKAWMHAATMVAAKDGGYTE